MACAISGVYDVRSGRAVVICNTHFNEQQRLPDIDFTNDAKLVKDLLQNLQIKQKEHHENVTIFQMKDVMRNVAESAQPEADCLVCVLLSHGKTQNTEDGDHDAIYATDDIILLKDLMEIWKCDRLEGIPKIFIVVACRGNDWSNRVPVKPRHDELHKSPGLPSSQHAGFGVLDDPDRGPREMGNPASNERFTIPGVGPGEMGNPASNERATIPGDIPIWKDCILVYTTQPGYAAPRPVPPRQPYSPLLKALVDQAGKRTELIKVVTYALGDVAYGYEDFQKKRMPWLASRLTKDVHFGRH